MGSISHLPGGDGRPRRFDRSRDSTHTPTPSHHHPVMRVSALFAFERGRESESSELLACIRRCKAWACQISVAPWAPAHLLPATAKALHGPNRRRCAVLLPAAARRGDRDRPTDASTPLDTTLRILNIIPQAGARAPDSQRRIQERWATAPGIDRGAATRTKGAGVVRVGPVRGSASSEEREGSKQCVRWRPRSSSSRHANARCHHQQQQRRLPPPPPRRSRSSSSSLWMWWI